MPRWHSPTKLMLLTMASPTLPLGISVGHGTELQASHEFRQFHKGQSDIPSSSSRKLNVTQATNSRHTMSSQKAKHRAEHTNRYHDDVFESWKRWNSFSSWSFAWNARTVGSPCSVALT